MKWLDTLVHAALPHVVRGLIAGAVAALTALGVLQAGGGVPVQMQDAPSVSSSSKPVR